MKKENTKPVRSRHPYPPFIDENTTTLIIGSMPPYRFCIHPSMIDTKKGDINFYYGSYENKFWPLLEAASGEQLRTQDLEETRLHYQAFLKKRHMGVTDVVESCIHFHQRSDDNSLKEIEYRPLDVLLKQYPQVKTLLCTSAFVKEKVNRFADKGGKYQASQDKQVGHIVIGGKTYDMIILYSPSAGGLRTLPGHGVGEQMRLEQYKKVFGKEK